VKTTFGGVGGATSFSFDQRKVLSQNMHLEGPLDTLLQCSLPHEMTHVILAHWARRPLPRWADEGAAILSESETERARYRKVMADLRDQARLIPLARLFAFKDYPRDVMAMYAEGHSIVGYLVEQGGRAKFLAFLNDGMEDSWDEALNKHYEIASVGELERKWMRQVTKELACEVPPPVGIAPRAEPLPGLSTPPAGKNGPFRGQARDEAPAPRMALPLGGGPAQALVELGKDGRLTVWWAVLSYQPQNVDAGRKETTYYVPVSTLTKTSYPLGDVKAYDMQGKRVASKKLRNIFKEQKLVLIAPDGQPVDPLHFRLYKEGTLLLVVPPNPVAPPAVPIPDPFRG
jgi:hypothetical protein